MESPLLRLPAEIRNHIWSSLFCNSLIIVRLENDGSTLTHSVCQEVNNELQLVNSLKDAGNVQRWAHEDIHQECRSSWNSEKRLDVLRACRQIHQEAALLPFSENSFCFTSGRALHIFLKATIPQQVRAIKSISIATQLKPDDFSVEERKDFERLVRRRLAKIDALAIAVEVNKPKLALAFTHVEIFRTMLTSQVLRLHRFSLKDVRVGIYCTNDVPIHKVIPFQVARNWEAELEQKLLIAWAPKKKRREEEEGRKARRLRKRREHKLREQQTSS